MKTHVNLELLWDRIYNYIDYGNLSDHLKKEVDVIHSQIFDILNDSDQNKYDGEVGLKAQVYCFDDTTTEDLRSNLGNWLIDNQLNLVFSNIMGAHVALRESLLHLYCIKNGLLEDARALAHFDHTQVADIYNGLHLGCHLSGAETKVPIEQHKITIGSRYFLLNKEINQDRLTRQFEFDVLLFEKKEAKAELKDFIEQYHNLKSQ